MLCPKTCRSELRSGNGIDRQWSHLPAVGEQKLILLELLEREVEALLGVYGARRSRRGSHGVRSSGSGRPHEPDDDIFSVDLTRHQTWEALAR